MPLKTKAQAPRGRPPPRARPGGSYPSSFSPPGSGGKATPAPSPRADARWTLQPLVLTVLALTWCCGDSLGERFETAKAFCQAALPKKRRLVKVAPASRRP